MKQTVKQRHTSARRIKIRDYFRYVPYVSVHNHLVCGKICAASLTFIRYGWVEVNSGKDVPKICAKEYIYPPKKVKKNFNKSYERISLAVLFGLQAVIGQKF